jgi:hypothetical protein
MRPTISNLRELIGGDISAFWWKEFDVGHLLPIDWQTQIRRVADQFEVSRTLVSGSVTSRELDLTTKVPVRTVGGVVVARELPWLLDLYRGAFRDLGASIVHESVSCASDDRIAINLNVQRGRTMRYECHVDSNPLEGLLYATTHASLDGGELVVAKDTAARGIEEISRNAWRIHPTAGRLVFFDARRHPHFVAALRNENAVRIVSAMNYYTPSCPEAARPSDLNKHLFGTD